MEEALLQCPMSPQKFWLNYQLWGSFSRMRRSTRVVHCLALVLVLTAQVFGTSRLMAFSAPVAKARNGAGAKDYVLVMHQMCPFAQRAWFALEESGLNFQLKEVGLGSSLVYDLNPKGLVPVLVDPDGKVIAESEDIVDIVMDKAGKQSTASEVSGIRQLVNQRLLAAGKKAKLFVQGALAFTNVARSRDIVIVADPVKENVWKVVCM